MDVMHVCVFWAVSPRPFPAINVLPVSYFLQVMCAYPAVNGVPACASEWALQELLVEQWGFDGYVVSDCLALQVRVAAAQSEPLTIATARLLVRARACVRACTRVRAR